MILFYDTNVKRERRLAVATGPVFWLRHRKLSVHWLRWAILCTALAADIFLGARYIADHVL